MKPGERAERDRLVANALLWDVLLGFARKIRVEGKGRWGVAEIRSLPLVAFGGDLFAVYQGNPYSPTCRLFGRERNLVIWADGLVRDAKTKDVLGDRDELAAVPDRVTTWDCVAHREDHNGLDS